MATGLITFIDQFHWTLCMVKPVCHRRFDNFQNHQHVCQTPSHTPRTNKEASFALRNPRDCGGFEEYRSRDICNRGRF
ncbi:unnamed protein product [Pleuronectes platessa]|uniref:Uncharacterized protein n=1 Tax=Pleuronectes platessa TaxID=8262 RepID=A0A9N7YUX5_PLEPL|nr:unnamed protein product [Pleuronectes platessa]